jgi:hypothetical protein
MKIKEENIDMTEACCESAAFKIHGRLAGEDRALSCLSFYVSYYSYLMQFVVAFVFCWVSLALLLSHLSHLSCVSAGVRSQGRIEGGDRALFCFPLLSEDTVFNMQLSLSVCNLLSGERGRIDCNVNPPLSNTITDDRRVLTFVCHCLLV